MSAHEIVVIDSAGQAAATCAVCGKDVAAESGVTARFDGRTLRFRCQGCLSRFAADPRAIPLGRPERLLRRRGARALRATGVQP